MVQELEFGWRIAVATVIGFLGSACGTVGGVGGGGIFVPMLTLIVGFDTKSAAALSKCKYHYQPPPTIHCWRTCLALSMQNTIHRLFIVLNKFRLIMAEIVQV